MVPHYYYLRSSSIDFNSRYSYPVSRYVESRWGRRPPGFLRFEDCLKLYHFLTSESRLVREQVTGVEVGYSNIRFASDAFLRLDSDCPNLKSLIIHAGWREFCCAMDIDSPGLCVLRSLRLTTLIFRAECDAVSRRCRELLQRELHWKNPRDTSASYRNATIRKWRKESIVEAAKERKNRLKSLRSTSRPMGALVLDIKVTDIICVNEMLEKTGHRVDRKA